ncbi:MAG: hypothetical protein IT518_20155 [Burkholderiales bacterium]|nr:hypothetical protein [Burkholderiales bacterium]
MTNPIIERFWRSMGERFGKRWLDEYGPVPTRAWLECLRPWDADVIRNALEMMGEKAWQHPPTLPQFQALLRETDRKNAKPADDFVRGYWRTVIVGAAAHAAGLSVRKFQAILAANAYSLGADLRALLDEFDARDKAAGRRTDEQVRWCVERASAIAQDHVAREAA